MESSPSHSLLLPYQRNWLLDGSQAKIWLAARQVGKSFALSLEALLMALDSRCNVLLLSASERQGLELMQKVRMHMCALSRLTAGHVSSARESASRIELPNGSRIICLASNVSTVRGFSGHVFLDEFAFHSDGRTIWRAIYPTITRGYKARICSSAAGMQDMFHELWSDKGNAFSRHRTDIHDAAEQGLKIDVFSLKRGISDPDAWAQEYECRFLDGATALIPYGLIAACSVQTAAFDTLGSAAMEKSAGVFIGMDIGRRHDLSVIWLAERAEGVLHTRDVIVMKDAEFSAQRETLYALMDMHNVRRACIDSSGIGSQLAEEAAQKYGSRVEAVQFTSEVKEDLAITTRRAFEDRAVRIPDKPEIRQDVHSITRSVTSSGNARFDAARSGSGHADRFWALALAIHASNAPQSQPSYERVSTRESQRLGSRAAW